MIANKREIIKKENQTIKTINPNNQDKNNPNITETLADINIKINNLNIQNNLNNTNIFNNSSFKSSENIIKVKFSDPYNDYEMRTLKEKDYANVRL